MILFKNALSLHLIRHFLLKLLEPSIPQLCEGLTSQSTAAATLQVFWNMAQSNANPLADHLAQYKMTAENFPKTTVVAIQVMVAIAKIKPVIKTFVRAST